MQQRDGTTEDIVIQRVQTNPSAYDIVLFNQRIARNLVNFCCTDDRNFKSILSWDFTFHLGKSPSYYVLAFSDRYTALINKCLDQFWCVIKRTKKL